MGLRIAAITNLIAHMGGAERVFFNVLEHMKRCGHRVDLYALGGDASRVADMGMAVTIADPDLGSRRHYPKHLGFMYALDSIMLRDMNRVRKAASKLGRICTERGYDVIFMNQAHFTPLVAEHIGGKAIKALYIHEPPRHIYDPHLRSEVERVRHDMEESGGIGAVLRPVHNLSREIEYQRWREAYDSAMASIDKIFVNSMYTRQCVLDSYRSVSDAEVAYPGVDTRVFRPLKGVRRQRDVVISVGPIRVHKMHHFAVRAISHLEAKVRPKLRVIGSAEEVVTVAYLRDLARANDVRLEVLDGHWSDEGLNAEYNRAGAVLHPNLYEPFGLVAVEAMAAEAPVVGVGEGGIAEVVKDAEERGYGSIAVLTSRDQQAFARALARVLSDPERAMEMGRQARRYVAENLGWERLYRQIDAWLENV